MFRESFPSRRRRAARAPRALRWAGLAAALVLTLAAAACATTIPGSASRAGSGPTAGCTGGSSVAGCAATAGASGDTAPAGSPGGTANRSSAGSGNSSGADASTSVTPSPTAPSPAATAAGPSGGDGTATGGPAGPTARSRPTQPTGEHTPTTPASPTRSAAPGSASTTTGRSIARVDAHGIITVAKPGATGALVLDVYEDPLCPFCARFEAAYGAAIERAVDAGRLTVRYRMVTFLDPASPSGDYSTRAFAAMLALAKAAGSRPGLFLDFHTALFAPGVQPKERGTTDLSDTQLAELARRLGAPAQAASDIAGGATGLAATAAATNLAELGRVSPQPGTPTVVHDGAVVDTSGADWLDRLLGG